MFHALHMGGIAGYDLTTLSSSALLFEKTGPVQIVGVYRCRQRRADSL
jgi:hypothetical protein